jgi:hypothetical protein
MGGAALPDNFAPNVADLGVRSTSVLRSELNTAITALQRTPGTPAIPQVGDFAGRLNQEVNAGIEQVGFAILRTVDNMLIDLLNLFPLTGVVLASVKDPIRAGQTGAGTFQISNLGANAITGMGLVASELKTLSGSAASIDPTHVTFSPNPVSIAPRSSTNVTVQVAVPSGQSPQNYYASIVEAASGQVRGVLSIGVVSAT